MLTGTPKKLVWSDYNMCHINNYGWIKIDKHHDDIHYSANISQNLFSIFSLPEYKFNTIDEAKEFAQKHFDDIWLSLTEVTIVRDKN